MPCYLACSDTISFRVVAFPVAVLKLAVLGCFPRHFCSPHCGSGPSQEQEGHFLLLVLLDCVCSFVLKLCIAWRVPLSFCLPCHARDPHLCLHQSEPEQDPVFVLPHETRLEPTEFEDSSSMLMHTNEQMRSGSHDPQRKHSKIQAMPEEQTTNHIKPASQPM